MLNDENIIVLTIGIENIFAFVINIYSENYIFLFLPVSHLNFLKCTILTPYIQVVLSSPLIAFFNFTLTVLICRSLQFSCEGVPICYLFVLARVKSMLSYLLGVCSNTRNGSGIW